MRRPEVRVVVLFEDQAQGSFARRLVDQLGLRPVRYENCVNSSGVLARAGVEVEALRSRNYQRNVGLFILIDADVPGFEARVHQLDEIVARCGGGARATGERIAYATGRAGSLK